MQDLAKLRHIVLDMDGTIYLGGTLFPFTLPFLSQLKQLGIGYTFVTNNCSHSRAEYVERLRGMGINVEPEAISTSAQAAVYYVRSQLPEVKRLFVLGTAGLHDDLQAGGFEVVNDRPDAVVVGFDSTLTYDRLAQTAYWISQKLPYIATHPDRVCPTDKPIVLPDCGAICALFESATGRKPDAIPGKPSPSMLQTVMRRYGLSADQTAMVGDRLYTDVRMAREAGAVAILTLSGEAKLSDVELAPDNQRPDLVVADLTDLIELIREHRSR